MKTKILFIFSIIAILMFSCKKDTSYLDTPDFIQNYYNDSLNVVSAVKNVPGQGSLLWKSNGIAVKKKNPNKIAIILTTYSQKFLTQYYSLARREQLFIDNIPIVNGDYSKELFDTFSSNDTSKIAVGFFRSADDGDVSVGSWKIDTQQKNSLKITNVNYIDSTFTGTFDFHFVESNGGNSIAPYSTNINFLDGKFTLPIPK